MRSKRHTPSRERTHVQCQRQCQSVRWMEPQSALDGRMWLCLSRFSLKLIGQQGRRREDGGALSTRQSKSRHSQLLQKPRALQSIRRVTQATRHSSSLPLPIAWVSGRLACSPTQHRTNEPRHSDTMEALNTAIQATRLRLLRSVGARAGLVQPVRPLLLWSLDGWLVASAGARAEPSPAEVHLKHAIRLSY